MLKKFLILLVFVGIFNFSTIVTEAAPVKDEKIVEIVEEESMEDYLFEKINEFRIENDKLPLEKCDFLNEVASIRAEEVSIKWSHTRPNGTDSLDMIPINKWAGENLSFCKRRMRTDKEICDTMFDALCNSLLHKDNILFEEFTKIGISTYEIDGIVYAAYEFSN